MLHRIISLQDDEKKADSTVWDLGLKYGVEKCCEFFIPDVDIRNC